MISAQRVRTRLAALGVDDDEHINARPVRDSRSIADHAPLGGDPLHAPHYAKMRHGCQKGHPILLEGPAASGKTFSVQQLAAELGKRLYVQQAYRTLTVEDIRGTRGPNEKGTTFEPGTLIRSLTDPQGWYFIDELNVADPGIICLLNNLLDGSREITIPETGAVIRPPEQWRFFGAYNAGYVATGQLNEALVSRCVVIECDHFPAAIEAELIRRACPQIGDGADVVVEIATIVRRSRENGEHQFDMCLRTCRQLAEYWVLCGDPAEAFRQIVLPKIGNRFDFGSVRDGLFQAVDLILSRLYA